MRGAEHDRASLRNPPACQPAVPSDPGCVFSSTGSGSCTIRATANDIMGKIKLKHLDAACEGKTLCSVSSYRITTNACAAGTDCTALDQVDAGSGSPSQCCTVTNGNCTIASSTNTVAPGTIVAGYDDSIEAQGCAVKRTDGPAPAFRCGLLVP